MLFSDHFIAGLLTRLRARAAGNPDAARNPETVGSTAYDAFDYGADLADKWWESLTEHLRGQYHTAM